MYPFKTSGGYFMVDVQVQLDFGGNWPYDEFDYELKHDPYSIYSTVFKYGPVKFVPVMLELTHLRMFDNNLLTLMAWLHKCSDFYQRNIYNNYSYKNNDLCNR